MDTSGLPYSRMTSAALGRPEADHFFQSKGKFTEMPTNDKRMAKLASKLVSKV